MKENVLYATQINFMIKDFKNVIVKNNLIKNLMELAYSVLLKVCLKIKLVHASLIIFKKMENV